MTHSGASPAAPARARRAGAVKLLFTPLELIERIAALAPPPGIQRHRHFGELAPRLPLRAAVTALALAAATTPPAPPPAPKYNDKRAEQPIATENPRLPHLTYPTTIRLARLKRPFFNPLEIQQSRS